MSKSKQSAVAYGHQGIQEHGVGRVEEVRAVKLNDSKITIRLTKQTQMSQSPLYNKYEIKKYDLHPNYDFSPLMDMIPQNVPEYIDSGEHYVERIVRSMYYFKQCALIGPSGTGKT